ncbi:hypothetical protein AZH53_01485 [Methanomicrobiaceae archaeon CYW5]|uniref:2-phospho-L-lactate transferase CofD family protein n=1 Tax=Methanovulcanius yangii TaxID=1789227 RepID=UPI0029C9F30D|nr:2-phospho-L-lactate transferase CofD family protein [Methanovulcanius yangii]MBT8507102.1 hypothetical protein [Methanovulcanius yangii]
MITVLVGGQDTLKILSGMRSILDDHQVTVVCSTADGRWGPSGLALPTIDSVIYLYAGIINERNWQGIDGDTSITGKTLERIGYPEYPSYGDRERALHIMRSVLLDGGESLTRAVMNGAAGYHVEASVLPVADSIPETLVSTSTGESLSLPDYREMYGEERPDHACSLIIRRPPPATDAVIQAVSDADVVIIGPGNPVSSLVTILACKGMKEALRETNVVAYAPYTRERAAGWREKQYEKPEHMTFPFFDGYADVLIADTRDPAIIDGALRMDTRTDTKRQRESHAWDLLATIRSLTIKGRQ